MEKKFKGKSNIDIIKDYVAGVRPISMFGWVGDKDKVRQVGEKWTDSKGIEWEQKDRNYRVRLNKQAELIRSMIRQKCPVCKLEIKWGTIRDATFFNRTGLCENCLIDYETKLRILGIYNDYEKYKLLSYELGVLKDAKEKIKLIIKYFEENSGDVEMLCNSEGFLERWKCTNKEQILKDARTDLKLGRRKIAVVSKARDEAKAKYIEGAKKYKLEIYV